MKQKPSPSSLSATHYQEGWKISHLELQRQEKPKQQDRLYGRNASLLKLLLISFLLTGLSLPGFSQKLSQTIRGKVIDQESQNPIPGASVIIVGTDPLLGSSSGLDGSFEIREVPVGRHTLRISSIGYEEAFIPELLLGSGKEVVLTIRLEESFTRLNEIVVTAKPEKGQPLNEMATVSARSFSVEETQRYAASLNDPARMVLSFAGVSSSDDGSNEIVVRGNSPRGILWRIEGIEVPNPNHFGTEGSAGGGISMLSANMMDVSDFYTGAFPAEYGNAYSGVFDINFRKGNNQKREYAAQIGLLGVDFAAEGPFKKGYKGSYLLNYRYSTLDILSKLGMDVFGNAIPVFQDLSYKIHLPTKKKGTFNLWGIGGLSKQDVSENGNDYDFRYNMGVSGLSHRVLLSEKTYMETTLTAAKSLNADRTNIPERPFAFNNRFAKTTYRASWLINQKLNARNTLRAGFIGSHEQFSLLEEYSNADTSATELDASGQTQLYQAYGQWKWRITEQLSINTGLHSMYLALNQNYSLEPRLGLRWELSPKQTLNAGVGIHSKMEPLSIYFSRHKGNDLPNKSLKFMRAYHYVLGYEHALGPQLRLKSEVYYQQMTNVPISPAGTDEQVWLGYSTINYNGGLVNHPLVNEGSGRNYGLEVSLERFLANNFYFTLTGSLYESKYTGRDGIERDSRFNGNYNANFLLGKEFLLGRSKNNVFGINIRTLASGGNRWTPVLLEASREAGKAVYDWDRRYQEREGMYFRTDLRLSYRRNKANRASIWSLDIQNVSNRQNVWAKYYDPETGKIETHFQLGLVPVLNYRIEF